MKTNTELIVLHTTRTGDSSIVVHTLSKEYGRRSFLIRGLRKKPVMNLLLPLNIIEADITDIGKSQLFYASSLTPKYSLNRIRNNIYKNTMTLFISEVIYRTIKEGTTEDGLYDWCVKNILLLDAIETDFSNFHIRFLLEFAVILGFSPEDNNLRPFLGEHYPIVERFMKESFADVMMIPLSGALRNEIADEILRYIEFHSDSSINIASLKVLRELFS